VCLFALILSKVGWHQQQPQVATGFILVLVLFLRRTRCLEALQTFEVSEKLFDILSAT
tara:strand:- start:191 stop:364 length:174 start_codon:yes stop_codon:yes gene_type:complete